MKKNLIFLTIGMFTMGCNSFMIASLLPQISQTIAQPIAITGQGITSFSVAYIFSTSLFSIIVSQGSARLGIQIALFMLILGNLITIMSTNLLLFLVGRFFSGLGTGIFTPLCITLVLDFAALSNRGKVLSLVWGANSAGLVFGVPFGLYLSSLFNWQVSISFIVILGLISFMGFSFQNTDMKRSILLS